MKISYKDIKFRAETMRLIDSANNIIREYLDAGFRLTLRQLYYQFVARDMLANNEANYKRLGSIVNDARLAGLIDWDSIEDRTRNAIRTAYWDSPSDVIDAAYRSYRINRWADQENVVEVWIEKEALIGVITDICDEYGVTAFACRGYVSQSEMWEAAQRAIPHIKAGKHVHILHLGDHDPSGIDMTRDIAERLALFLGFRDYGLSVHRLALNMEQIDLYQPPPNPAKTSDARFESYLQHYGDESWELDALSPQVIVDLIREQITDKLDLDRWDAQEAREARDLNLLRATAENWDFVAKTLEEQRGNE